MIKFSKNKKLNGLLNELYDDVNGTTYSEIERYYNTFLYEPDYNFVQYGNLLVYYNQVRELYQKHNYKTFEKYNNEKVWEIYKRQVGYIIRYIVAHNN